MDKVEQLRSMAATAVICDPLDVEAVARAAVDAAPDAIVHELTLRSAATGSAGAEP